MMTTRGKGIAAVGLVALLMLLGACGREAEAPRQQPPLTLPSGPSSSAPAGDGGDWTTYHRDNARTGYLPGLADPHG